MVKEPEFNTVEAAETLRMAIDAASIGVWDLDVITGELRWSMRCREIFGVSSEAPLRYEDFLDHLDPSERTTVHAAVQNSFDPNGSGEYDIEYTIIRRDGEKRWAAAKGRAFFAEIEGARQAVRFVGTILDRSEQKLAQAALLQAERMAGTGRLAASIAHEINNPIESVTNLLYLLRTEKDVTQRETYLSLAESELARVTQIATNTLRFYRDPVGEIDVDLKTLILSVLSIFQGKITQNGVQVGLELDDLTRRALQGELRQILVNLISNALDAMPKGGRLRVRTSRRRGAGGRQSGISILISDTGHGMSSEVVARVFRPFFTTKGSAGTGLGLWLSSEIAHKHGFHLKARSSVGRGTTFQVFMPDRGTEAEVR